MSMDDLVHRLSGLEIVQKEFLLFDLYDVYRHCDAFSLRQESFEDFIAVGEMMLSDFSEIDLYCVDAKQLFSNLDDAKKIEAWGRSLGGDLQQPSEFMINYLAFYRSLYEVYEGFRQHLAHCNRAYGGMAYRKAAECVDSMMDGMPYNHVYFVGFNALSKSEQYVVRAFVDAGRGTVIADGDDYYFSNIEQEAGHFLRMMFARFRDAGFFPAHTNRFDAHFAAAGPRIHLVACPENVLQAKYVGQRLQELIDGDRGLPPQECLKGTAVVLADEKMLVPVLNSLPEGVKANVTMGFPFAHSMVCGFVLKLLELHANRHADRFYHADVVSVLSDPYVCRLVGLDVKSSQLIRWLNKEHLVYSTLSDIERILQDNLRDVPDDLSLLRVLFDSDASSANGMIKLWDDILNVMEERDVLEDNKEKCVIQGLRTVVRHFVELQQRYDYIESLDTLRKIYDRFVRRLSISLIGDPSQGLQITGMLEARNLDFERIILVSADEGVLPAGMKSNSLIPYDLKGGVLSGYNPHTGLYVERGFGMPTYNDRDAIYANHFYSLIQRASEIDLVYCTDPDAAGKGEPSRFVMQVRDELAPYYGLSVDTIKISTPHSSFASRYEVGTKSDAVMARLHEMIDGSSTIYHGKSMIHALSPSALNTFGTCSMQFFYKYILHLREQDELSEEAEASDLGDCVHAILEDVFRPSEGPLTVTLSLLNSAITTVDENVAQWFINRYGADGAKVGRNYMMQEVAKRQITNYLKYETSQIVNGLSTIIHSVESEDLSASIVVPLSDGKEVNAWVAGRADRIDVVSGPEGPFLRIVDYKTGNVKKTDLQFNIGDPDAIMSDKWFQVMFYAWIYKKSLSGVNKRMASGIIPLQHNSPEFLPALTYTGSGRSPSLSSMELDDNAFLAFENELRNRLQRLLDPAIPFSPLPLKERTSADHSKCKYCPVLSFCRLQPDVRNMTETC